MSNSNLVVYTKLSPNCTRPRNHKIDTITIHCMAGNLSVETCGNVFASRKRRASSNYGIGSDGRIALYVDEGNRSWCSGNAANDHRAITIEVANTVAADPWPVSDAAYQSLIKLCADICRRNGIKKLLWRGDKRLIGQIDKQNMTVHRWMQNKSCPGDWLYNRHGQIAAAVNALLGEEDEMSEEEVKAYVTVQMAAMKKEILDAVEKMIPRPVIYNTVEEVPEWGRESVQKRVDSGVLLGTGDGLGLTNDMVRFWVVADREEQARARQ